LVPKFAPDKYIFGYILVCHFRLLFTFIRTTIYGLSCVGFLNYYEYF